MCAQCMATTVAAGAAATGVRAWLATRRYGWLTRPRMRGASVALIAVATLASATAVG